MSTPPDPAGLPPATSEQSPANPAAPATIPYQRFAEVNGERQALKAKVDAMTAELETLRKGPAKAEPPPDVSAQIANLQRELTSERELRVAASHGWTDPEAVETARWIHGRQKDAPPFGEWIGTLTDETLPPQLRPFRAAPAAPSAPGQPPAPAAPPVPRTAIPPQAPSPGMSPVASVAEIQTATREMLRGNPAPMEALKKSGRLPGMGAPAR